MKFLTTFLLVALAAASPVTLPESGIVEIKSRQLGASKTELESGSSSACPKAILIFARGSTETGNLGTLGVPLGNALERRYGAANIWVQGVGDPYDATLGDNFLPRGTSVVAIREGIRLLNLASNKCPNSAIVTGGYSQGSALIAAALTDVTAAVRNKVIGTVLFGYTKNLQNRGGVPNYPSDRLEVFCAFGDLVCSGTLTITAAHLSYSDEAGDEAPKFLISKIGA